MCKVLVALFMLPVLGPLLLAGVIVGPARAQAPAGRVPAATIAPPPPQGARIIPAAERLCCGMGGPDGAEGLDLSRIDVLLAPAADQARWRLPDDSAAARRFTPPEPRYNSITLSF